MVKVKAFDQADTTICQNSGVPLAVLPFTSSLLAVSLLPVLLQETHYEGPRVQIKP
jgi:hypothetical protein